MKSPKRRLPVSPAPRNLPWAAILAGVIFVGILLRVAHLLNVYPTPVFTYHRTWPQSDMYSFDQWARRIVAGDVLCRQIHYPILNWMRAAAPPAKWTQWFGDAPVYLKAPLYAYLIAALRWLFGDPMLPLAIVQILVSAVGILLVYKITQVWFDTPSAALAASLFAVYGPAIHYDVVMLRGPLIGVAALLVTWLLIRFQRQPTPRAAAALGFSVGLALLVNEGFFPVPVLVLALIAWWVWNPRRLAIMGSVYVLALLGALVPLIVRNLIVGAPPFSLAVTGTYAVAMCNAGDSDPLQFRGAPASFLSLMEISGGRLLNVFLPCLRSFRHGIGEALLFYLRRATGLIVPFENPDNANFYYAALNDPLLRWLPTYAVLFPLTTLGLAYAGRQLQRAAALLPMSLTLVASMMLTLPISRYRATFAVLLFPFAGTALAHLSRAVQQRRLGTAGLAAGAFCLLFVGAGILQSRIVFAGNDPNYYLYRSAEFIESAHTYMQQKQFRRASQELSELAQVTANSAERTNASLQAARLLLQAGDVAGARASLQALLESRSIDAAALLSVGDTFWRMLNDPASALVAYRRASALHPAGDVAQALRVRLRRFEQEPTTHR